MNRIDTTLAKRVIETAGENRVPVADAVKSNDIVQGAMDNFHHNENTQLVYFGSHDTILMLFQNLPKDSIDTSIKDRNKISIIPKKFKEVKNTDDVIFKSLVNSVMNGKNFKINF